MEARESVDLGNLGLAYSYLGEPRKAIEFLRQALAIGKAIEDPRIISFCEKKLKKLEGAEDNETQTIIQPPTILQLQAVLQLQKIFFRLSSAS